MRVKGITDTCPATVCQTMERPELELDRTTAAENASEPSPDSPSADPQRAAAHASRAQSMPAQASSPQAGTGKVRGAGGAGSPGQRASHPASPGVGPDPTHLQLASALEKARSRLLDQTHHNRLLSYRELARDVAVLNQTPDQVFQQLVEMGGSFYLEPGPETAVAPEEAPAEPAAENSAEETVNATEGPVASAGPDAAASPDSELGSGAAPIEAEAAEPEELAYVLEPDGTLALVSPATESASPPAEPPSGGNDEVDGSALQAPVAEATVAAAAASEPSQTLSLESPVQETARTAGGSRTPEAAAPASAPPQTLDLEPPAQDAARTVGGSSAPEAAAPAIAPPEQAATASELPLPPDGGQVLFDLSPKPQGPQQEPITDGCLQTPLPARQFARRLGGLYRAQQRAAEETGVNRLHLAFGFLRWREGSESPVPHLAPLVLVPVHLETERRDDGEVYQVVYRGEGTNTNHALAEKLRHELAITLPVFSEGQAPEAFWREVEASVIDHAAEGWGVVPNLVLAEFPVDGQSFWYDLEPSHWPTRNPLLDRAPVRRMLLDQGDHEQRPGELTQRHDLDVADSAGNAPSLTLVRDADPYQHAALVDALQQKEGLVVEGPPGSGKSQTITNLIAAALGEGKSVLFVAQKRAALEVVQRRLAEVGLDPFCLELHGRKSGNKALLESLRERLAQTGMPPGGLERRRQELAALRQELVAVSGALSEPTGPEALPLHDVLWRQESLRRALPKDFAPLPAPDAGRLDQASFKKLRTAFDQLGAAWAAIPKQAAKAWQGFVPTNYQESQRAAVEDSLRQVLAAVDETTAWLNTEEVAPVAAQLRDTRCLVQLGGLDLAAILPPLPDPAVAAVVHKLVHSGLFSEFKELLVKLTDFRAAVKAVDRVFDYQSDQAQSHAETLHKQARLLVGKLCGESVLLADLPKEVEQLKGIIESLESLPKLVEPVVKLQGGSATTLEVYAMLADEAEKLASGPGELLLHANPGHAKPLAAERLAAAIEERDNLTRFAQAALGMFALERMPDPDALKWAYRTLQQGKNLFGPKSAEYKRAVDLIRSTLKKGGDFSNKPKFHKSLESFIQYCEWCQELEHSEFYRESFGFLFKGMDSNWNAMERLVQFSQGLRQKLGDAETERILSDWEGHTRSMGRVRSTLLEAVNRIRQYKVGRDLPESLWRQPVTEMVEGFRQWLAQVNAAIDAIRQPWCNGRVALAEALGAAEGYQRARDSEKVVRKHPAFEPLLAGQWKGAATEPEGLEAGMAWVDACLRVEGMDLNLLRWLTPTEQGLSQQRLSALMRRVTEFRTVLNRQYAQLKQLGEIKLRYWLGTDDPTLAGFKAKVSTCLDTLDSLPSMARWRSLHGEVSNRGYGALVQAITSGRLAGEQCGLGCEYSVYAALLEQKIAANPVLASFTPDRYEKLRQRFAGIDREILAIGGQLITARLRKLPVPAGVDHGPVNAFSEKGLLSHELGKTAHYIPVRQLLSRAPNALKALKPCFMMSPFAVAQYLPADQVQFDLVIFDEASQLWPEVALGAMARGTKVVVFGDAKQLPPSPLPAAAGGADPQSAAGDALPSVFDVCLRKFPRRRLRRHYRSRHEQLFRFCHEQFYGADLSIPSSPRGPAPQQGVAVTFVEEASCANGRNPGEAEAVVEDVINHYQRRPDRSLGVVAFSEHQADTIDTLLASRRAQARDVDRLFADSTAAEPLFIKSLGQVQGDERDVIFISATYGPDGAGSAQLDWRAVNVAATRGRERVQVFSSLKPTETLGQEAMSGGIQALRAYLEHVRAGQGHGPVPRAARAPESDAERTIAEAVEALGYRVIPGVGPGDLSVDLGVVHPDRPHQYLLGIMCDGAGYHSGTSVRERDRLRPALLKANGWVLHHVWSVCWYRSRDAEMKRLEQAIEACLKGEHASVSGQVEAEDDEPASVFKAGAGLSTRNEAEESQALTDALERFWEENIKPHLPERESSILSAGIIERVVAAMPLTAAEWQAAVPGELRSRMDSRQTVFLDDILAVIADHA